MIAIDHVTLSNGPDGTDLTAEAHDARHRLHLSADWGRDEAALAGPVQALLNAIESAIERTA